MPNIDLIWEEGSGKYCTHPIVFHSSYNLYLICMSLVGKWVRRGERERCLQSPVVLTNRNESGLRSRPRLSQPPSTSLTTVYCLWWWWDRGRGSLASQTEPPPVWITFGIRNILKLICTGVGLCRRDGGRGGGDNMSFSPLLPPKYSSSKN